MQTHVVSQKTVKRLLSEQSHKEKDWTYKDRHKDKN